MARPLHDWYTQCCQLIWSSPLDQIQWSRSSPLDLGVLDILTWSNDIIGLKLYICYQLWDAIFHHPVIQIIQFWYHWKEKIEGFQTSPELHNSDNWMTKCHASKLYIVIMIGFNFLQFLYIQLKIYILNLLFELNKSCFPTNFTLNT